MWLASIRKEKRIPWQTVVNKKQRSMRQASLLHNIRIRDVDAPDIHGARLRITVQPSIALLVRPGHCFKLHCLASYNISINLEVYY